MKLILGWGYRIPNYAFLLDFNFELSYQRSVIIARNVISPSPVMLVRK